MLGSGVQDSIYLCSYVLWPSMMQLSVMTSIFTATSQ